MSEVLAKQVWLYGWGQRMAKLAPKGHHVSRSLVLIGLAIEAEEPSGLVQVNVAGWHRVPGLDLRVWRSSCSGCERWVCSSLRAIWSG